MRHSLLAFRMKVYPAHLPLELVEANVVEALKARSSDGSHAVVRNQEVLFPAHEDVLSLRDVMYSNASLSSLLVKRSKGAELAPVAHVRLVAGSPVFVQRLETILGANDLALEEGRERWMILGEPWTVLRVSIRQETGG